MGTAIAAWLAKEGVGLLLGALAKLLLDLWNDHQAGRALKQAGAAETAAKVNAETVETQDAMDQVSRPSDDAVADSLRTGKF
ncbi:hypothetical protein [Bradyrhizobium sp. BRP23]|uniref:hypothetical protein n=1 Tax=Bradyrhizobium sp. BRP23 TaxID=2793820 RepID=UPI001CD6E899|nr:hypothetical protein [Bradyrhizobium sp. BRP23]MCA1381311.1 hypothetical protein [Bradyrhizobium sp. BRP05]MCA1422432.1 hypothetical protein [Bradyrhizobium sp. BRP23]